MTPRDAVDSLEGRDAIHWDIDRREGWPHGSLMRVNKARCKVLHTGQGNPQYHYRERNKWIDCSPVEEGLGILVSDKLSMHWHCALVAHKLIYALGCIQSSVASGAREVILFVW